MKKNYTISKYEQILEVKKEGGNILIKKVHCTCRWHSLHPKSWKEGKQVCWHVKSAIIQLKREGIK